MAVRSLLANKLRTFLSMLGIIIGVSTVIAVFAVGRGAQEAVDKQFRSLSANSIIITANRGRNAVSSSKISAEDALVLVEKGKNIKQASATIRGSSSIANPKEKTSGSFTVFGTDERYLNIANLNISEGEGYTAENLKKKSKVAVIGHTVAETLFESSNPIGNTITVSGKTVEIIGVLKELGSSIGPFSNDNSVFMPYSFVKTSVLGTRATPVLTVIINDIENVDIAKNEITQILRKEHRLREGQEDDFRIINAGSIVDTAKGTAKTLAILLTAVAAITLLVSGIGIMNVMFVTVAERTKEIGIAKAVGGKQFDILGQFLLESVILSTTGGIIGIILGELTVYSISSIGILQMSQSFKGAIIGFSFSAFVGIFFGFYPAYKASKMDPVDALRSE
jgi:putative ABC transport system permease protein